MRFTATICLLPAVFGVAACSSWDTESFRAPDSTQMFRAMSVTNSLKEKTLGPVAPEDLVDASGACAGASVAASPGQPGGPAAAGQDAGVPSIPSAVALEMSECDVVRRTGTPSRVAIGTNDRQERTAVLTYTSGSRPGIYSFVAGRLKSMEADSETFVEPKVAKKAKGKAKPARAATRAPQSDQISVQ